MRVAAFGPGDTGRGAAFADGARARGQASPASKSPADSQEALTARIDAAYKLMMEAGRFDEGYAQLRAALLDAARSDLYEFTVESYSNAGATFLNNQILDYAEEIFAEGLKTRAMQQDVAKRADFYLNYAMLKQAEKDYQGFVSMCATATNLYAHYHGTESQELMYANDVLATGVAAFGQIASAINIEQRNLEMAERVIGTDDRFTWKLQNNLADMLRQMGAPTRALQYDLNVLEKRIGYYGAKSFQRPGQRQQHGSGLSRPRQVRRGLALFPAGPGHRRRPQAGRQSGRAGRCMAALHQGALRRTAAR